MYLVNTFMKEFRTYLPVFSTCKTIIIRGFFDILVFILDVQQITPNKFTYQVNLLYDAALGFVKNFYSKFLENYITLY